MEVHKQDVNPYGSSWVNHILPTSAKVDKVGFLKKNSQLQIQLYEESKHFSPVQLILYLCPTLAQDLSLFI